MDVNKGIHRRDFAISIIIPTHNRSSSLKRTLDALGVQTYPLRHVEVLVIADGCIDNTVEMLRHYEAEFTLYVVEQSGKGAAAARNRGAAQATGPILLFLDDDVEPTPHLIESHISVHRQHPRHVVIGSYPPLLQTGANFFSIQLHAWWEAKFNALRQPGHRFTYRDVLSGNLSLKATLFNEVGGFDETIRDCGAEDYEFGIRLLKADIPFYFAVDAGGHHHVHETMDLARALRRARQEGEVDVIMGQRYPELLPQLALAELQSFRLRHRIFLRFFLFVGAAISEFWFSHLLRALHHLEKALFYDYWQTLYSFLYHYSYWRGVADKVGTWRALVHLAQADPTALRESVPTVELDLSCGLALAEQQLDVARPKAVCIRYGQQPVGVVPLQPGAEPLRGIHLRSLLTNELSLPLLEAMALEGAISEMEQPDRVKLFKSIRSKSVWFGPTDLHMMWFEQYSQWNALYAKNRDDEHPSNEDWVRLRQLEHETVWQSGSSNNLGWRDRIYSMLYRCHQPLYHWYTARGWTWPNSIRARVKQLLRNSVRT